MKACIIQPLYSRDVSFSEDSEICGASMVVSPYGKVLKNMKGRFGMATVEFEPIMR